MLNCQNIYYEEKLYLKSSVIMNFRTNGYYINSKIHYSGYFKDLKFYNNLQINGECDLLSNEHKCIYTHLSI